MSRVGLMVGRFQPLHLGHTSIINEMIQSHHNAIVGIGSTQKQREKWDPWTFEERKQMLRNVYGDRLKIVQLQDLGTTEGTNNWVDYVIDKITKLGMPAPTDYFTGSRADACWYTNRFFLKGVSPGFGEPTSSCYATVNRQNILRKLHIVDRAKNPVPPATDLRTFMELRSEDWKKWVPQVNWDLLESTFPEELKVGNV